MRLLYYCMSAAYDTANGADCTAVNTTYEDEKASQALAQGLPTSVPRSYRALADHSNVPSSTLHARTRGQQSIKAKAHSQ